MTRLRIIFMGSPDFAIPALDALHAKHDVVAVYSQPPRRSGRGMKEQLVPVARHAQSIGLQTYWPSSLKGAAEEDALRAFNADLFVVVAYGLLLPQAILDLPRFGCVNGHASLLPRWRGAAPIQRAIEAGDSETGISAMLMEAGLDTGPVLASANCAILNEDTAGSLHDKLAQVNADLLLDVVNQMPTILQQQQIQNDDDALYAAKISPEEAQIDWQLDAETLDRHIRAFSPFPGAWFVGPKGRIKLRAAYPERPTEMSGDQASSAGQSKAGTFLGCGSDGALRIATGGDNPGVLNITHLQPAGKKPMSAQEFLNGQSLATGTLFAGHEVSQNIDHDKGAE